MIGVLLVEACATPTPSPPNVTPEQTTPELPPQHDAPPAPSRAGTPLATAPVPPDLQRGPRLTWNPGDAIPGWEDFDCEDLGEPGHAMSLTEVIDVDITMGTCVHWGQCSTEHPAFGSLYLSTLADDEPENPQDLGIADIFFAGSLTATIPEPRGQGWYQAPDLEHCGVADRASGGFVGFPDVSLLYIDACGSDGWYAERPMWSWVCIARMRPDEVRGVAWMYPVTPEEGGTTEEAEMVWSRVDFDLRFPDHSGFEVAKDGSYDWKSPPTEVRRQHFYYNEYNPDDPASLNATYDLAWPWADITDPWIRAQVYNRYIPYGPDFTGE